jgi:CRP/FNR family transcriptional regulator, cyclic AMP receptor protein
MIAEIRYNQLRDASLFKDFPDEVLQDLAKYCHYVELHAGETLFQQDDPSDALYILEEGQIHVIRKYEDGDEVILATENPFYAIGELSMLADRPRTGTVVAVSDCALIGLQRDALVEACARVPEVGLKLSAYLSQRLYRMNLLVRENAIGNLAARVASVILMLSGGKAGPIAGDVRVSRVARAVSVDADAAERIFQGWAKEGYIAFDGLKLTVHDIDAIRDLAG